KLFPLRSCADNVLINRTRPCVLQQIGRCCAPCVGLVDKAKYKEYVEQTVRFMNGRKEDVVNLLRRKMQEYSEEMAFEKAAQVRDRIRSIERTIEKEKVVSHRLFDRDVIGLARDRGRMVLTVFGFRAGNLEETGSYEFKDL